jgi:predicted nucleotidyltransferase
VFFMEAENKVFRAFYDSKNRWLYFSELRKKTGLSNSSLQNILNKLEKRGKLEKDKKTSNIFFRIKSDEIPLIFSQIDKEKFDKLNNEVRIPLKNWLKEIPKGIEFILLFGSSSRKQEKEGSDIDLLVGVYKFNNEKLQKLYEKQIKQSINNLTKKINSESIYPLKVIFTNTDTFKTTGDYLIKQARETGFPIFGNLQYYKQNGKN